MSKCPAGHTEFASISYEGRELRHCLRCRGFWFANGQFKDIKQIGFSGLCPEAGSEQKPGASGRPAAELACPDCARQTLVAYNYAYSSEIRLHRCPVCKGIWADPQALADIEALLTNYRESLEEAKARALPLMMEVKRQFEEQEHVREVERRTRKKPGFIGKLFRKKAAQDREPLDIFADLRADARNRSDESVGAEINQEHNNQKEG